MTAIRLQAAGRTDPIGVSIASPMLTWGISGSAIPDATLVDIAAYDGERLHREETSGWLHHLAWPIEPLASQQRVTWRVGARLGDDIAWSPTATIEAGLWAADEWGADAITHPAWAQPEGAGPVGLPELEVQVPIASSVSRARLYLTGCGVVVPELNGVQAIPAELEPGYSTLPSTLVASAWDVGSLLTSGDNRLVIRLGTGAAWVPQLPGRYTKFQSQLVPYAKARLDVWYTDGHRGSVVTDGSWRARLGPTTLAHWYGGEDADLRRNETWVPAHVVDHPTAAIRWRAGPPVRVVETVRPTTVRRLDDGSRLVDFGVNLAGRPRVVASSTRAGKAVVLRPAEVLTDDGRLDQRTIGGPTWDSVVPDGSAIDWRPSFVYQGGRYLAVEGLADSEPDDVTTFEVLRVDNERVGEFHTSDPFLMRLHQVIDRAVQGNMHSVFTDCPHREKLGWLEQLHYCFGTLARAWDVRAHLADAVSHMMDAQTDSGLVPSTAPELVVFDFDVEKGDSTAFRDDPNWGRAIIEVPWLLYEHYGDDSTLRTALGSMQRYLEHLRSRMDADGLLDHGLGDWIELDRSTPRALVASHGWAVSLATAARCATVAGREDLAVAWSEESRAVWQRLRSRFRAPHGRWGSGSQGSWALAWTIPDLEPEEREAVLAGLLSSIRAADGAMTVGEVTLPSFVRALTESGNADLLFDILRRDDVPGYGLQLASDATSLAEMWNGPSERVGSQNHFMLGAIDEWILADVVGLRQAPGSIGWRRIEIRPTFVSGVDRVSERFVSPMGTIEVSWHRSSTGVVVEVSAPPTVECEVDAPGAMITVR